MTKVADLATRVEALEVLVSKLSVDAKNEKKPTNATRKMTEKGELHKAKLLFYQEKKESKEVNAIFKNEHGDDLKISFKNWTVVKKITDAMFEKLTQRDKDSYIEKTKMNVMEYDNSSL